MQFIELTCKIENLTFHKYVNGFYTIVCQIQIYCKQNYIQYRLSLDKPSI